MSSDRSRLGAAMDDAHGTGLHLAGHNAALDDVAILLATEVERREDGVVGYYDPSIHGLRWALKTIQGMRP